MDAADKARPIVPPSVIVFHERCWENEHKKCPKNWDSAQCACNCHRSKPVQVRFEADK